MNLHDICKLISRPREFFERLAGNPVFLRAATLIATTQIVIVIFCLWMKQLHLTLEIVIGSIVYVVMILIVKCFAAALFLYLVIVISGKRSDYLYRQCLSVFVYCYFIVLLGSLSAVALGVVIHLGRGTVFSVVRFLNANNLLAAVHLPVFMALNKADIFAAWFVGELSIGTGALSALRFPATLFVALLDWIFVAAIQESITQLLRLSFYN